MILVDQQVARERAEGLLSAVPEQTLDLRAPQIDSPLGIEQNAALVELQ